MPIPFTILHHTAIAPEHYDLLVAFPDEPLLRTWRILPPPDSWRQTPPQATRQPDHRQIYLTYEGNISDERGHVRRVFAGQAELLAETQSSLTLRLTAGDFACTLTLPCA